MATKYGLLTTAHTGIPDNIDLAKLNAFKTSDGVGYGEVLGFIGPAARAFGSFDWPDNPDWAEIMAWIVAPSADQELRWRIGEFEATRLQPDSGARLDIQRRQSAGSQVPEVRVAVPLPGYTWDAMRPGLNGVSRTDVESDVLRAFEPLQKDLWAELLRAVTYKAGRDVRGSSTGQAVGWAGATEQNYVKPRKKGVDASSDQHYLTHNDYADSANGRRALFAAQYALLDIRHSSSAPLLLLHGRASLADVKADSAYEAPAVVGVTPGGGSTTSVVTDVPLWAHGKLTDSGAWCVDVGSLLPEHYYVMLKSYGRLSDRNPVRLAYPQDLGFGPTLFDARAGFPVDGATPQDAELLLNLFLQLIYGMAVKEPALGTAGLIGGAGSWTDPTIT